MADSDKVFAGSIPKLYDTLMVPLIFEAYAGDMAARIAASRPMSVLETAAGSGVVTRALAPRLGHLHHLYRRRLALFRHSPPPANWDGVFRATDK